MILLPNMNMNMTEEVSSCLGSIIRPFDKISLGKL